MLFKDDEEFDFLVKGTTVCQATRVIEMLDKDASLKILNIESTPWYGGADEATMKLEEALKVMQVVKRTEEGDFNGRILIDAAPNIIWMDCPLTQLLIDHGQSHTEFRPIQTFGILNYDPKSQNLLPICIPLSREQIVLDSSFTLIEKRLMMKLLTETNSSDFGAMFSKLTPLLRDIVLYAVCQLTSVEAAESTVTTNINWIFERLTQQRMSMEKLPGKHGLLYAYGGSGTINQVLCRIGAISGRVTHLLSQSDLKMLEEGVISGSFDGQEWSVKVKNGIEEEEVKTTSLSAKISSWAVICKDFEGMFGDAGCAYWIIPASSHMPGINGHSIFILQLNSSAGCCPDGHHIIYIWSTLFGDTIFFETLIEKLIDTSKIMLVLKK